MNRHARICAAETTRHLLAIAGGAFLFGIATDEAAAQTGKKIWDIELGGPVAALPLDDFVDPACGTNGGPPSLPLDGFDQFVRCPVEQATGLREVWFIYDNEAEYVARARRDDDEILRNSANSLASQPIVTSLLIDAAGLVQGYRVVTDPRAPTAVRIEAYALSAVFKGHYGESAWVCTELPPGERERRIDNALVKESCAFAGNGRVHKLETRRLYKGGQDLALNPRSLAEAAADIESTTRLEVYSQSAVKDAPCCRASTRP